MDLACIPIQKRYQQTWDPVINLGGWERKQHKSRSTELLTHQALILLDDFQAGSGIFTSNAIDPVQSFHQWLPPVNSSCNWAKLSWLRSNGGLGVTVHERDVDDDSYDETDEHLRRQESDEEDPAYFPVEESKPPHY